MMTILFSPIRHDAALTLEREGDRLVVNGAEMDFSDLAKGARLGAAETGSDWVIGAERAANGALSVTVLLPHGADPGDARRFPATLELDADGPVPLP